MIDITFLSDPTSFSNESSKPRHLKYNNHKLVLSILSKNGELTVSDIATRINLSKTTITKIISSLEKKSLVYSTGKGSSTDEGGKKPVLYAFNSKYRYGISIILGYGFFEGAVMDLRCNILHRESVVSAFDESYENTIKTAVLIIKQLISSIDITSDQLCGIAICCEGVVDSVNGIIRYPIQHSKWEENLPVRDDLRNALPFETPIYVENVCCLAGFRELLEEENQNYSCLVTINTIESTGGCVIRNNQLIKGKNGFIGEVGHIIIDPQSAEKCLCGGTGCFEALVAPHTLYKEAVRLRDQYPESLLFKKSTPEELSMPDIFLAADAGDGLARCVLDSVILYFLLLIHNILLLHDPDLIIIQETYARSGCYFRENLIKRVHSIPFYKIKPNFRIDFSAHNEFEDFLTGGAFYIYNQYLNNDSIYD